MNYTHISTMTRMLQFMALPNNQWKLAKFTLDIFYNHPYSILLPTVIILSSIIHLWYSIKNTLYDYIHNQTIIKILYYIIFLVFIHFTCRCIYTFIISQIDLYYEFRSFILTSDNIEHIDLHMWSCYIWDQDEQNDHQRLAEYKTTTLYPHRRNFFSW